MQREARLDRLFEGANAIALAIPQGRDGINAAIDGVLAANGMEDGAHLRLMATRGTKATASQDPQFIVAGPTLVITAEYKTPRSEERERGLSLFSSAFRTLGPDVMR